MKAKYMLHPGFIRESDGRGHWIHAEVLARLYGLAPGTWVSCRAVKDTHWPGYCGLGLDHSQFKHLYPRYDGKYELDGGVDEG